MDNKPKHSEYFEGILQLRNPTEEIINFIADKIEEKPNITIAKTKKQKNGIDLYLSSQKFLQTLGRLLKSKFTGQLIISRSLFTRNRQTSKDVYRVNVLFRYMPIKPGQTITYKGEKIKILNLGTKISGKNIKTGKKVLIDYKEITY